MEVAEYRRYCPPGPRRSLSVVAPAFNEEESIPAFFQEIIPHLDSMGLEWELVVVDDGSEDATAALVAAKAETDARVVLVRLARNFGKEVALTAGLDVAGGDAVIPIDIDLQHPPEVIATLVERWREGFDVVNAVRASREGEGLVRRTTARLFYWAMNRFLAVRLQPDVGDFRLLDRRVVEVIKAMRERNRFMKGLCSWPGFRTASVPFVCRPRQAGTTRWNYWRLWNFALTGMVGFSSAPLRLALYLGLAMAAGSFCYGTLILVATLLWGNPVPGYASLMVGVSFLGGVQLMSIGLLGEYIGRIFEEVKGRPLYVISDLVRRDGRTLGGAGPGSP